MVIPVSWSTIDIRNNKLYIYLDWNTHNIYKEITIPVRNYSALDFAAAVQLGINNAMNATNFGVSYDIADNMLCFTQLNHFEVCLYGFECGPAGG